MNFSAMNSDSTNGHYSEFIVETRITESDKRSIFLVTTLTSFVGKGMDQIQISFEEMI